MAKIRIQYRESGQEAVLQRDVSFTSFVIWYNIMLAREPGFRKAPLMWWNGEAYRTLGGREVKVTVLEDDDSPNT